MKIPGFMFNFLWKLFRFGIKVFIFYPLRSSLLPNNATTLFWQFIWFRPLDNILSGFFFLYALVKSHSYLTFIGHQHKMHVQNCAPIKSYASIRLGGITILPKDPELRRKKKKFDKKIDSNNNWLDRQVIQIYMHTYTKCMRKINWLKYCIIIEANEQANAGQQTNGKSFSRIHWNCINKNSHFVTRKIE